MKVLIAEDDMISGRALEKNIRGWGYDAVVTTNGKDAWQALNPEVKDPKKPDKDPIRIAVLDWEMPYINGIDLCKKIRTTPLDKKDSYLYIILLTGRDNQDDIIQGLSAGADDYITKPYNFLELKVRLNNGERIIQLENKRIQIADTDDLTQLCNRDRIHEILTEETERCLRENTPIGVIWADIDNFKQVNDNFGHITGDLVLIEVAKRLKKSLRKYDKIGRCGGDEFLAVIPTCGHDHVAHIAERFRRIINAKKIAIESDQLEVTISVGATSSENSPNSSPDILIKTSDKALYEAKNKGRNCSVIKEPE